MMLSYGRVHARADHRGDSASHRARRRQASRPDALETLTGITRRAWQGVYWARWSDALRAAGLVPNPAAQRLDQDVLLKQAAEMVRRFGKLPVEEELRIARRSDPSILSHWALRSFGGRRDGGLVAKLRELATSNPAYLDILDLLPEPTVPVEKDDAAEESGELPTRPGAAGQVYLARMGKYYKIGMSRAVGRRIYELERHQPEPLTLVHALQTDDPEGIERYWHERFEKQGKRLNGEWFDLSRDDVAAFKRRGRFM